MNYGVSLDFANEVSERVKKLKQFAQICDTEALQEIDQTARMLQAEARNDSYTGVPPPQDQESIGTSYASSVFQSDSDHFQDLKNNTSAQLKQIKKTNTKIKSDLEETLKAFKQANELYMHNQEAERSQLNLLEQQIQDLRGIFNTGSCQNSKIEFDMSNIESQNDLQSVVEQIARLQADINQATSQMQKSDTEIKIKEQENRELKSKIAFFEQGRERQQAETCGCSVF